MYYIAMIMTAVQNASNPAMPGNSKHASIHVLHLTFSQSFEHAHQQIIFPGRACRSIVMFSSKLQTSI